MVRPRSLLPALVAVAGLTLLPGSAAASPATSTATGTGTGAGTTAVAGAEGDAPLVVTIGSLSPAAVPVRGPVRITGTVTNRDTETWSTVNLYPFASETPMTSRAELTEAAATDPEASVGDRLVDQGPYATIPELAPGESAPYTLTVARRDLPDGGPGVYWFGVHALGGADQSPRDMVADGRARTFLPLVEEPGRGGRAAVVEPVRTALVVPLRGRVRYAADGSVAGPAAWARTLGAGGRLRSLLDLGTGAGNQPVTWLVDPAIPDAVARLAAGNPARSLAATIDPDTTTDPDLAEAQEGEPGADGESASPSAPADEDERRETPHGTAPESPGASEDAGEEDEEQAKPEDPVVAAAAAAAADWLADLRPALEGQSVLALPYGDLDVAAAAVRRPAFYPAARALTGDVLSSWGIASTPAVAPPSGLLSAGALDLAGSEDTLLVSDRMIAGSDPTVASVDGRALVVASAGAAEGGPGPDDRTAAVAVRQRILAEAAVRRVRGRTSPLVVTLPTNWRPSGATQFFAGLDLPWVDLTTLDRATDVTPKAVAAEDLRYPATEETAELDGAAFAAAAGLRRAGHTLQNLLTLNDRVGTVVEGEALTGLSYEARSRPQASRRRAEAAQAWIDERVRSVDLSAPPQVTLSSASGRFSVTVANNLDEPVTVGIEAFSDEPVDIEVPETIDLAARSQRTVLLVARTDQQGVHNVTLVLTDLDGTALGASDQLPIRAAQVSAVIWVIIGIGFALLAGAVGVRLARRLRRSRLLTERGSDPDADPGAGPREAAAPAPAADPATDPAQHPAPDHARRPDYEPEADTRA
ncbi:DUF6049 family protein [Nocardioides pantholopis]|uniref:DUF6049 family protein n=1 Tax=Nocardioides pantholopis TaxID=2483798 RepID=UPI000FDB76D5|nr:DUF6049 family protein [Nocardioides pantholopis]